MTPARPRLILVTGRPGAGKTTLAHALAREIHCPAICRDEIKEGLVHSHASATDDLQQFATDAFFATVELLVAHRVSLVAEAAFQHRLWSMRTAAVLQAADVRLILCTVDQTIANARRVDRAAADATRDLFHPDAFVEAVRSNRPPPPTPYDPPRLGVPTLEVDTTDGYAPSLAQIAAFVRS